MFPSRNNPPSSGKAYAIPPDLFQIAGPWKNIFNIVTYPYPGGFTTNDPPGTLNTSRGTVFAISCNPGAGVSTDCGNSRNDFNLFAITGSPAGGNLVNSMYYSPDLHTLYWTDTFRIQAGNGGANPNLIVDGTTTTGGLSTTTLSATGTTTLPAATTINSKNPCLQDGTNCPTFAGTTGSIGGGSISSGSCTTGTATVTGATIGSPVAVSASDGSLPNPLVVLSAAVTSTNTVTVQLCAISTVTPTAKTYKVRVIQ